MGVPADVRAVIGKHELIRSLQTGDLGEARRAHGEVYAEFKKIIADARNGTTTVRITVDPQAATIALAYWSNLKLAEAVPAEGDPQTPWPVAEMIGAWEKAVITPDGWRAISGFDGIVSEMITLGGMPVAPTDPNVAAIRRVAAMNKLFALKHHEKARIEAVHLARAAAIRSVDLDEMVVTTTPERALPAPSLSLSVLFEQWLPTLKVQAKEVGRLKHQHRRMVEFFGDRPANHVARKDVAEFMGWVARFPRHRTAKLKSVEFRKLVEGFETANAKLDEPRPTLTKTTVDEWFASYKRMFAYGVALELIDRNPCEGMSFIVDGAESVNRRAFSDEETAKLFAAPFISQASGAKRWLPILALLHGARLSEMAAMPLDAFKKSPAGHWFFDLTDRKLKTDQSERLIPLHPDMIRLGWLDYIAGLREAREAWLFPDLDHESKFGPAHEFSKWFGRSLRAAGFTDPALVFHSFRHTWKRRARASEVKEEIHDIISGHKGQSISRKYGEGADIGPLAEAMAFITFPALLGE